MPLNDEAVAVLSEELGRHPFRVSAFKGKPIGQANTRAWRNALERAGIKNYRRHDLRHVGHVAHHGPYNDGGTAGAWRVEVREMVRRHAYFALEQLQAAAARLATFSYTPLKRETRQSTQAIE